MQKEFTCIICPNSCLVRVEQTKRKIRRIEGPLCKKGEDYVQREIFSQTRTLTSSIRVTNGELELVSVKTDRPIPKGKIMKVMEILYKSPALRAPIKMGDVLIENVAQTGANIVATKSIRTTKKPMPL